MEVRITNKSVGDPYILFKQAVTSLSASLLLLLFGEPPTIAYLVIFFFGLSVLFLIAGLCQIFPTWNKIPESFKSFDAYLTYTFILISLASIFKSWANILEVFVKNSDNKTTVITFLQSLNQLAIPIWLIVFFVFLSVVFVFDSVKNTKRINKELGTKRTVIILVISFALAVLFGVFVFYFSTNYTFFYIILLLVIVWMIFKGTYLEQIKVSFIERKNKTRESANAVSRIAKSIGSSMTNDYPPKQLKATVNVTLKQLEDELQTLRAHVNSLK
jgi:hypothetical protein